MQFGRLTALERVNAINDGAPRWRCVCTCGKFTEGTKGNLVAGRLKSCGCLKIEVSQNLNRSHSMSKSRTYRIWQGMLNRCYNQNVRAYKNYGGRGIIVCDRWHIFENFFADMGDSGVDLTIERKDNNGNYEPSNCVWASRLEQGRNTRKNRILSVFGQTLTVSETASMYGLRYSVLISRLNRGWDAEQAVTVKVKIKING